MIASNRIYRSALGILFIILLVSGLTAQKKSKHTINGEKAVLWEQVDIRKQDLFLGPGGTEMMPDLSRITFIADKKGGHSKKYEITDGAGRKWTAKIGDESQSETAALRFLWAIGYKTEVNYLVPTLTIPGKGTFTNVRLKGRPEGVKKGEEWEWGYTPFEKTRQMQGLKLMMAFLNNWDTKAINNVILKNGDEREYVVSDLGATFGKMGSSSLPLFWRIGRSRNKPLDYSHAQFIKDAGKGRLSVVFNGKNRGRILKNMTIADARWLADLLSQLSDKQIRDAFRAANYSSHDVDVLTSAVEKRINQLNRVVDENNFAIKK